MFFINADHFVIWTQLWWSETNSGLFSSPPPWLLDHFSTLPDFQGAVGGIGLDDAHPTSASSGGNTTMSDDHHHVTTAIEVIVWVDAFTAVFFTIEYVIRLSCSPRKLRFFVNPMNLVSRPLHYRSWLRVSHNRSCGAVAKSVEHPSKVLVWCNSTDWCGFEFHLRQDISSLSLIMPRQKVLGKNPRSAICCRYKSAVCE